MKNKSQNFIASNFKESWNYIKKARKYIYLIIALFFISAIMGAFLPTPEFIVNAIRELIRKLFEETLNLDTFGLIVFIFKNNLKISLYGLFLGIAFCFIPIIFAVANGYVLGYVAKITVSTTSFIELWRLLPHGIIELIAVLISLGLGVKLGASIFINMKIKNNKNYWISIWKEIISCIRAFIFIILPLLVIAAVIEGVLIKILA